MSRLRLAVSCVLLICGCGYRVLRGDTLFGVRRIAVMPFEEAQSAGMAPHLAEQLTHKLAASGLGVAGAFAPPDQPTLDGTIHLRTAPSVTRLGVTTYQLGALVHAELRDAAGARLWAGDVAVQEDFLPAAGSEVQPLLTETPRRTALRRLAERAAAKLHETLLVAGAQGA